MRDLYSSWLVKWKKKKVVFSVLKTMRFQFWILDLKVEYVVLKWQILQHNELKLFKI